MTEHLPGLNVSAPSSRAQEAAETLLRGFHHQDLREEHLKTCNFDAAQEAATHATRLMGQSYQLEFPTISKQRANEAGELFMHALFLQDEIENWPEFAPCFSRDSPVDLFVTTDSDIPETCINDDPRWENVHNLLLEVCRKLKMNTEFATLQTRFWRHHGQQRTGWQTLAFRAHKIKVHRMVPTADEEKIADLARYFVAGVERHDQWNRHDADSDIEVALDVVSRYYQCIFDLLCD